MSNSNIKSIIQEVEYGSIKTTNLNKLMEEKQISTYQLSVKTNIRFQTIQNLRENISSRIDFEVLAKICYCLECSVSDVLEYEPTIKA